MMIRNAQGKEGMYGTVLVLEYGTSTVLALEYSTVRAQHTPAYSRKRKFKLATPSCPPMPPPLLLCSLLSLGARVRSCCSGVMIPPVQY